MKDVIDAMQQFSFHNIVAEVMDDVYMHYHDEKLLDIFGFGDPKITQGDIRQYLTGRSDKSYLSKLMTTQVDAIRRHLG